MATSAGRTAKRTSHTKSFTLNMPRAWSVCRAAQREARVRMADVWYQLQMSYRRRRHSMGGLDLAASMPLAAQWVAALQV